MSAADPGTDRHWIGKFGTWLGIPLLLVILIVLEFSVDSIILGPAPGEIKGLIFLVGLSIGLFVAADTWFWLARHEQWRQFLLTGSVGFFWLFTSGLIGGRAQTLWTVKTHFHEGSPEHAEMQVRIKSAAFEDQRRRFRRPTLDNPSTYKIYAADGFESFWITESDWQFMLASAGAMNISDDGQRIDSYGKFCATVQVETAGDLIRLKDVPRGALRQGSIGLCPEGPPEIFLHF